jgi:hypothetical protein
MLIEIRVELHKQAIGHVPRQGNLVDANSIPCSCYILYCEFNPPMMMGGVMGQLGLRGGRCLGDVGADTKYIRTFR